MMGRLNHDQGELFYSFCLEEVVPDVSTLSSMPITATASRATWREGCAAAPASSARRYGPASANRSSECENSNKKEPSICCLGSPPPATLVFDPVVRYGPCACTGPKANTRIQVRKPTFW